MYVYGGNIKRNLTGTRVVVSGSEWYLQARYCERCNENWGYIKGWEFIVEKDWLQKQDFVAR